MTETPALSEIRVEGELGIHGDQFEKSQDQQGRGAAYQEGAIELEKLIQRRNQLEERLAETTRRLERLKGEQRSHAEFADLGDDIKAVCAALDDGFDTMGINERMALCQKLIERVVVDGERAEIHYRLPVSSNCNRRGKRDELVLAAGAAVDPGEAAAE